MRAAYHRVQLRLGARDLGVAGRLRHLLGLGGDDRHGVVGLVRRRLEDSRRGGRREKRVKGRE